MKNKATTENKINKEQLLVLAAESAKKNCNKCYGRGVQNYLVGDGYKRITTDHGVVKVKNEARTTMPCPCTKLQYTRVKK